MSVLYLGILAAIPLLCLMILIPFFIVLFLGEWSLRFLNLIAEQISQSSLPQSLRTVIGMVPKLMLMIFKSIQRNMLRTSLTYLATFVLVLVVTMVWSILAFIDAVTSDKAEDFKIIITERYQIPSQMPLTYISQVQAVLERLPPELRPTSDDFMTWSFVGGSLDPQKRTFENSIFLFCLDPICLRTMMDGIERKRSRKTGEVYDELSPEDAKAMEEIVQKMKANRQAIVVGKERLRILNKQVGDVIEVTSFNFKDIVFRFEIIGTFPEGRYDQSAAMNLEYLVQALEEYKREKRTAHPLADKSVNLIWIRLPNREAFNLVADVLNNSSEFSSPPVKVETASSAIGVFLEAYKDIFRGMRYLLSPAILITMALVISNAISISVRERRTEMAVLKVLGYQPWQIMLLVLGEAVLVGVISGFVSAGITVVVVNNILNGLKFPIAFFPAFFIPKAALWWGPVLGAGTAIAGSFLPAWSARTVKVSEVFSKIA
jgi:putative ABC transport system permease protein